MDTLDTCEPLKYVVNFSPTRSPKEEIFCINLFKLNSNTGTNCTEKFNIE